MEPGFQRFGLHLFPQIKAGYHRWINKRLPKSAEITLNQRRIFILPTRLGLLFGTVLILLLLMAINYQNSMIFAYTFLLASLFPVVIIFTFRNLSGITVRVSGCSSVFVGESAKIDLTVSRADLRQRQQLHFEWQNSSQVTANLIENDQQQIALYLPATQRGPLKTDRLYLHTNYPLGLIRAWSWLRLELHGLVYPKPIEADIPVRGMYSQESDAKKSHTTTDEISGLRSYVPGDSPKQIAWKSFAATGELNVKQFEGHESEHLWLDLDEVRGGHIEYRLSVLCYWILKLEAENRRYGLRLANQIFELGSGPQHQNQLLSALALFGSDEQG
ncbi:MAG: DUF58 domain-containing protein [Pseudomonadales bacterium]|nr:DUF58 domain-containing protein [Pseudomonadales bacterium]